MLTETTEKELLTRLEGRVVGREGLFFSTPLCGTCRLGERMLEIAIEAGGAIPVSKLNINFTPVLRERWQISSVPCLVILQNGIPVRIEYALGSVVDLHDWLNAV